MSDYLDTGTAAHAIDLQIIDHSVRGYAVATGVTPSKGTDPLTTEVTAGTTLVDGVDVTFASTSDQSVLHSGGDTDPRRDVVYVENITGDAVLQIAEGTPAAAVHAQGDTSVNFADAPFEFAAPAPPSMNDFNGTPVAEVAIPAGATDYTEATHLRSLRTTVDLFLNKSDVLSEHHLPSYDNVNNAPAVTGNIIRITGDGTSEEGVYVYNGTSYVKLSEQLTLQDIIIDANRDWGGYNISNVGELEVNDSFRVEGGRGSFSLPDQHTRYADGLSSVEAARWSLAADEKLEVTLLEVTFKGGGNDPNFVVELVDESASTTLASTSNSIRGSPVATSSTGADVSLQVTNTTGGPVDATISGQLFRVLA